jgi:hypothetical protein
LAAPILQNYNRHTLSKIGSISFHGFGVPELIIVVVCAAVFAHWLWMLVEAAKEPVIARRVGWLIVVVLIPGGQIVYQVARWIRPKKLPV